MLACIDLLPDLSGGGLSPDLSGGGLLPDLSGGGLSKVNGVYTCGVAQLL